MRTSRRTILLSGLVGSVLLGSASGARAGGVLRIGAPLPPYSLDRSAVTSVIGPAEQSYSIMVAWPAGDPPSSGWPVLYVLDGEDNFATFALSARRFERARARSGIAPGVVVGIAAGPLNRRVRDYTPAIGGYRIADDRPAAGFETGGADAFIDFLARTVMPMVQGRWPIDKSRQTLAGHSFGGLLALQARLTRPDLFDRVVAISPSFWFGDGYLAREAAKADGSTNGTILIMTGAEEMGAAHAAGEFLAALPETVRAHCHLVDLPGQSHGSTMLAALPHVLKDAFGTGNL